MSDDIQKETERIHQGIVESLSFSEALAKRDAEIERLRELLRCALTPEIRMRATPHYERWIDRVCEALER